MFPLHCNFKNKLRKIGTNEEQFISNFPYIFVTHQNAQYMKKFIISILFISIILGLTLVNVTLRKDSTNIDIKIQNIEAFGNNEDGGDDPCKAPGGVCMTYDKDGDPIFHIGLSIP